MIRYFWWRTFKTRTFIIFYMYIFFHSSKIQFIEKYILNILPAFPSYFLQAAKIYDHDLPSSSRLAVPWFILNVRDVRWKIDFLKLVRNDAVWLGKFPILFKTCRNPRTQNLKCYLNFCIPSGFDENLPPKWSMKNSKMEEVRK